MSRSRARKLGFVFDLGVELARRFPIHAERPLSTGMIPDAGCNDAMLASHARHLAQPGNRVCHEMNDELRQGRVERLVWKRQVLRRGTFHVDPGMALSSCGNERF